MLKVWDEGIQTDRSGEMSVQKTFVTEVEKREMSSRTILNIVCNDRTAALHRPCFRDSELSNITVISIVERFA